MTDDSLAIARLLNNKRIKYIIHPYAEHYAVYETMGP